MAEDSFVFYRSFRDAISVMPPEQQLETLLAICDYALDGTEPDLSGVPYAIFTMARPVIASNAEKRKNGKKGGRPKKETDDSETEKPEVSNNENHWFSKNESNEDEDGDEDITPQKPPGGAVSASFNRFWEAYPKKVGKQAALKAFRRVNAPLETLLSAIERQKRGDRWSRENGRFIPNPATWLNQGRWEDEESGATPPPEPETERRGWF